MSRWRLVRTAHARAGPGRRRRGEDHRGRPRDARRGLFHEASVEQVGERAGCPRDRVPALRVAARAHRQRLRRHGRQPGAGRDPQGVGLPDAGEALTKTLASTVRFWSSESGVAGRLYGVVEVDPAARRLRRPAARDRHERARAACGQPDAERPAGAGVTKARRARRAAPPDELGDLPRASRGRPLRPAGHVVPAGDAARAELCLTARDEHRRTVAREWGRIGCIGFGGPPAHIALLRELCVDRRGWLERARVRGRGRRVQPAAGAGLDAARDLLRLACPRARRARSSAALCFIVPGLVLILALAALFLGSPPRLGARRRHRRGSRGCGGRRAGRLEPRPGQPRAGRPAASRWASTWSPARRRRRRSGRGSCSCCSAAARSSSRFSARGALAAAPPRRRGRRERSGGLLALCWVAFKVGALSYGGGLRDHPADAGRRGRPLPLADVAGSS